MPAQPPEPPDPSLPPPPIDALPPTDGADLPLQERVTLPDTAGAASRWRASRRSCGAPGKSAGTTPTYVVRNGEIFTGTCESEDGKMLFILRSHSIVD